MSELELQTQLIKRGVDSLMEIQKKMDWLSISVGSSKYAIKHQRRLGCGNMEWTIECIGLSDWVDEH